MEICSVTFFPRHTRITVRFRHHLYCSHVPGFAEKLLRMLPSLREHECINRRNLSFEEELGQTELGHAFEHVILEALSLRGVCTRGQTVWNWERDPIGTYHVTIHTGKKLVLKESLLVAQAIMTNALVGPLLGMRLPKSATGRTELPVYRSESRTGGARPERMLFALQSENRPAS